METDNPTGPEASVEDRLNTYFAPEAATEEAPEEPQAPEDEAVEEVAADDSTDEATDEVADEPEKNEPNDPAHLRALVTRKTMEAATVAKAAHDRLQYAEAREQFAGQIVADVAELKSLEAQLKQYEGIDLGQLYATDPGSALRLRDQRDDIRRQVERKQQEIAGKGRNLDEVQKRHYAQQWQFAVDGAKQRIGQFTPGEDMAMLKQVQELGFTEEEIRGRYADPRILHAIYKAAKWDTLQSGKAKTVAAVQKAPPVVKPGASKGQGAVQADQYKKARDAFKRSGSLADGARLLMLRGIK
jgi:hypothetical protein